MQKYGGTSVETLDRIRAVARHIQKTVQAGHSLVVAVSAMGQQTDDLLGLARSLSDDPPRREVDMLLTAGERITMALLAIALDSLGVQSTSLTGSQSGILTDETHGNARIQQISAERIRASLGAGRVVIVAGFQGVSPRTKEITTLGRGGTDLTAIAIAAAIHAERCEIYKDVDGVCTADPRLVASAKVLPELTWREMSILAWSGASVLHARGVHVGATREVSLEIRSSFNLESRGTKIVRSHTMERPVVKALSHKSEMKLIEVTLENGRDSAAGFVPDFISFLWERGESPLMYRESSRGLKTEVRLVVSTEQAQLFMDHVKKASPGSQFDIRDVAVLTLVGEGLRQSPELVAKARQLLGRDVLEFELQTDCLTAVIVPAKLSELANAMHRELLG